MPELIRAKHAELNVVCEVPDTAHYLDNGWTRVADDTPVDADSRDLYDPADFTAEQVVAYLGNTTDPAEHERVQVAEKAGKARKTVLDWSAE
ncbi:MAG: hypothetical protein JWO98_4735 [Frankiales bacterium]|nr:hypothetical protein [Frankiales bacterium]